MGSAAETHITNSLVYLVRPTNTLPVHHTMYQQAQEMIDRFHRNETIGDGELTKLDVIKRCVLLCTLCVDCWIWFALCSCCVRWLCVL